MAEEMTDISINEEVPTDTKKKKNATNSNNHPKRLKPRIDFETPVKKIDFTGNFKDDVCGNKKIFNKGDSVEKCERNAIEFVADTSRRAFVTAEKEEQRHLDELVANVYYPEKQNRPISESEVVCSALNFV